MNKDTKVVCCCRGGQVRSVAARHILAEYGFRKVLACGLEMNDAETVDMLLNWADVVIVVGSDKLIDLLGGRASEKVVHFNIGPDIWGNCFHPDLTCKLRPLIAQKVKR